MKAVNKLLYWFFKSRYPQIEHWKQFPHQAQNELMNRLLAAAGQTVWGKRHQYAYISNLKQYKKNVPIQDYDSLKPYIDSILAGTQNVLWHTPIQWMAKSSGTTSDKSKFIPLSHEAMQNCHFKGGKDIMALYCKHNPNTQLYTGKGLVLGGSHQIGHVSPHIRYGDLSAVLMQNMPVIGRYLRTPSIEVSLMDDWEQKLTRTLEQCLHERITHMAGVPTWLLVLLKRVLATMGKQHLHQQWPTMELYFHGGVSFTPYEQQFRQLFPEKHMQYWQTYNASEGFFGLQDEPFRNDMLLMLDYGIYYEFMPMSEINSSQPITLSLQEVEVGKNYALIISTNAGLWRYKIGDTIMFTDLKPYRIVVSGRTKHYINAFGEEVIIDNADKAIAHACKQTNSKVKEYTAAPIYFSEAGNGSHEWLIEFEQPPASLANFTQCLDKALQRLNSDYEAKRFNDIAMRKPVVHAVSEGTFYRWLKHRGKLGGQHKVPRLANHRKFIEGISAFETIDS